MTETATAWRGPRSRLGGISLLTLVLLLLAAAGAGLALWWRAARRTGPAAARPPVILISLDTVRPDHLGCGGAARPTSPNLDRFASNAAWFVEVRCQAPWTLPSHMSLFTSLRPSHNQVEDINQKLAADIPTLPELLQRAGYRTAAFVNNGQMKPHWGFGRGFDVWNEYEVDTPDGAAKHITDEVLRWLPADSRQPFFLFLHYYDAHDPYDPPPPFREQFGVTRSSEEIAQLTWQYRMPGNDCPDPAILDQLRAAYDAEIAGLDQQLGRLLAALPPEALVVIFSDHGEAFEEHGWTTHGAALYEEEIRCVLMIRPPHGMPGGRRVSSPAMLLDVAPTILGFCGLTPPAWHEGIDLRPALAGQALPVRRQVAETKKVLEGRVLKAGMDLPLKLIYSLPDGNLEMFRLPDETRPLPPESAPPALAGALRRWMNEESYWLVHLQGSGRHDLTLTVREGRIALFIPFGLDIENEPIRISEDGRELGWSCYPGTKGKQLYLQTTPADAAFTVDVALPDNRETAAQVFVAGPSGNWLQARPLPVERRGADPALDPFPTHAFHPPQDGIYIAQHRSAVPSPARPVTNVKLDEKTMKQLRSLGYAR